MITNFLAAGYGLWILLSVIGIIVLLLWAYASYDDGDTPLVQLISAVALVCLIWFMVHSEAIQKAVQVCDTERSARIEQSHQPYLFSADPLTGCEIYKFEGIDGYGHYFTKCPNATTTTDNTLPNGKSTRREQIPNQ